MSTPGVELATVWLRMVPTMEGATENVVKALIPAEKAAWESGKRSGSAWSSKLKGAIGVAAIGTAVVGAFKGLYEVGAIFDDVTDTIRVGTGAQGEALDGLVRVAKNVGNNVPASFDKIGGTVADLNTRLGLSGDTLTTVASQYLEAGRILKQDVDINATSAAFNAFKIEGDGVSAAMDTLFQVSQATGVGMNELASGAQTAAPALQNPGFTFEDSVALLGSLDKAGLNTQQVMSSLSKGLVTLAKDGEEPQAAFQRVTGELQSFVDTGDTAAALDLASQIFGTRGAAQFVGALQAGALNLEDLQGAVGATGDTILGVAEETADFTEQWQIFKNRALTAIEPVGTLIFQGLGGAMRFVNELFRTIDVSGVFGPLLRQTGELAPLFAQLWSSLSPVALVFKALTPVLPQLSALLGEVAGVAGELAAAILPPLSSILSVVVGVAMELTSALAPVIVALVQSLAPILKVVASLAASILVPALRLVASVVQVVGSVITWLVKNIVVPFFNGIMIPVIRAAAKGFTDAFGGLESFFSGMWAGIQRGFRGFVNFIIDGINGFLGGLNQVGSFLSDVTGGSINFSVGKLPRLAEGATILPRPGGTAAILAEAGRPESVVDTGLMNQALREGLAGTGTEKVVQNITLKPQDPRLAMRQLGREAERAFSAS